MNKLQEIDQEIQYMINCITPDTPKENRDVCNRIRGRLMDIRELIIGEYAEKGELYDILGFNKTK